MADDRPTLDPIDALADLQKQFTDYRSTLNARLGRRAVGTLEPSAMISPHQWTLFCQGQTVTRGQYTDLFNWVTDNGLFVANLFGVGDGSTTFTLPNFNGRQLRGMAATGEVLGTFGGNNTRPNMDISLLPSHTHSGSMTSAGNHSGHRPSSGTVVSGGAGGGNVYANDAGGSSFGDHTHNFTVGGAGGSGSQDMRQKSIIINWLIWT